MSDLPQGWESVTFPQICQMNPRKEARDYPDSEMCVTFVPMASVDATSGTIAAPIQKTYSEVSKGFTAFRENDVIMAKITPCMENGKAAVARNLINGLGFGSTEFHVFRSNGSVLPEYIFHYIRQERFRSDAETNFTGSVGQRRVPLSFLEESVLPLPPVREQRRIVEKLETLLVKAEATQKRLDKIPVILKRFRQSVLAAACSGKLTADWRFENTVIESADAVLSHIGAERDAVLRRKKKRSIGDVDEPFSTPSSWRFCFLEDIAAISPNAIKAGPFGSSLTKSMYVPSGYKIYGQEQVIRGNPDYGDYYVDEVKFKELRSCEVAAGDILVSLVGTIGKTLIIPDDFAPGIINPRLVKFSLHPRVYNRFIQEYLNSTLAQNLMSQQSHGGTMEILNLGMLKNLPVPLAPLEEQKEIVRRVEDLFKFADQIEERYKKARSYTDKLTQSILAKAFRGELVRQNPNDEPASRLLERIREEKQY